MASDYYDIFKPSVEQFAYLRCPEKIRAAMINAGGKRLPLEAIKRALNKPTKPETNVGEPTEGDAVDFRVTGLVKPPRRTPGTITDEERKTIAKLAQGIKDRPPVPRERKFRYQGPPPSYGKTAYADSVIERVCTALEIPGHVFFSTTRQKYVVAARALVVALLRERNAAVYSYPRIAEIVGRNDHSTMIHAHQQFPNYCKMFPVIAEVYDELRGGE